MAQGKQRISKRMEGVLKSFKTEEATTMEEADEIIESCTEIIKIAKVRYARAAQEIQNKLAKYNEDSEVKAELAKLQNKEG